MTVQQLIYFREVARTLHFTKASQNLYVTQSALSYSISGLERELDVPLFIRESGKRVRLTSFGDALLPLVDQAICCFDEIESTIKKLRNPMSGVVNIAYSYINCSKFVPRMFSRLRVNDQFKDISVNFEINHSNTHFENDVANGRLDLAFSCTPSTAGLEVVPFAKQELYVMVACDHPFAVRDSVTIEDLADEVLIGYDKGRNLDRQVNEMFYSRGFKPNTDIYVDEWSALFSLVALGKGISIFPMISFEPGLIRAVPLDHPMHVRDVYMMWAANRKLPPAVEYVRDYCLSFYDEPPVI